MQLQKIVALSILITLVVGCSSEASKAKKQKAIEEAATLIHVGDIAPDFTVSMLNGSEYTLSDLKGKVVLVNFWATWCGPCMQEFQVIPEQIVKRFANKEFMLLPISRGEKADVVAKKMDQLKTAGIDFPVGLDLDKSIYNLYASSYIPRNFLVDQSGKVVYTSVGYSKEEFAELCSKIEELLK